MRDSGGLVRSLVVVFLAVAAVAAQSPVPADRLDQLEAGVRGAEALRDARRIQHAYAQYLEFALWNDLADLFAENGTATYGTETVTGREKLRRFYVDTLGKGRVGLEPGQYMPHFALARDDDDRRARCLGHVGRRHLRERVRPRERRLEDRPPPLLPGVERQVRGRRLGRNTGGRAVPLRPESCRHAAAGERARGLRA